MLSGQRRSLCAALFLSVLCISSAAMRRADGDETAERLVQQARQSGNAEDALKLLDHALQRDPKFAEAYYLRGRERFRQARIDDSIADFERYAQLRPQAASRLWELGIAYYYAGEFEQGAKQFELYQTYHDNDVENSVWRYLCVARGSSVAKAREGMLPIKNDPRVPMMQIYKLYRGELQPDDVLAAVKSGDPADDVLRGRMFYAALYLALWYEAGGQSKRAMEYLQQAVKLAGEPRINGYMGDVARVHMQLVEKSPASR